MVKDEIGGAVAVGGMEVDPSVAVFVGGPTVPSDVPTAPGEVDSWPVQAVKKMERIINNPKLVRDSIK